MAPRKQDGQSENGAAVAVPEGWASVMFDKAFELQEAYTALIAARKANRDTLRNLEAQGLLSDDEVAMVNELYAPRRRGSASDATETAETTAAE